jgi:RNA polymerase sigma-70 factor (ECF subfamily)
MSDAGRVDGPPGQRLSELFAAHNVELTRFAIRRVGEARAGDIVAETFLVAWRRLDDVPADNARAWLYATARYVIAHEVRSQRRRDNLADEAERDAGPGGR